MPLYARLILIGGWLLWLSCYFKDRPTKREPRQVDRRGRWGMLFQAAGFLALAWNRPAADSPEAWRVAASVIFFLLGALLSWTSVGVLGRHFRVDAGLDADHRLVRGGAYRFVRHPIYASVLCVLLGTGLLVAATPQLLIAMALGVIGTEIRARVEDRLLAARFGEEFRAYRRSTPAYIPFLR